MTAIAAVSDSNAPTAETSNDEAKDDDRWIRGPTTSVGNIKSNMPGSRANQIRQFSTRAEDIGMTQSPALSFYQQASY